MLKCLGHGIPSLPENKDNRFDTTSIKIATHIRHRTGNLRVIQNREIAIQSDDNNRLSQSHPSIIKKGEHAIRHRHKAVRSNEFAKTKDFKLTSVVPLENIEVRYVRDNQCP